MKILFPYCPDLEMTDLRGFESAVELYGGFMDPGWEKEFGSGYGLNRMSSFRRNANFPSFDSFLEAASLAARQGIPVNATLNALSYSPEECGYITDRYLRPLSRVSGVGVIVSSPALCRAAHELRLFVSVSTIAGCYHSDAVKAFRDAGANSVIIPRELTLDEIAGIRRDVPEMDLEVFVMSNGCRFSDSVCMGCHIPHEGSLCGLLDRSAPELRGDLSRLRFEEMSRQRLAMQMWHRVFMKDACGLCALWRMERMGIARCKLVGRSGGSRSALGTLRILYDNMALAQRSATEEEYLNGMELPDNADFRCTVGLNCYYPEVRFPAKERI